MVVAGVRRCSVTTTPVHLCPAGSINSELNVHKIDELLVEDISCVAMGYQLADGAECTELPASLSPEDTRPAAAATSSATAAIHAVRSIGSGLSCSLPAVEATELPAALHCCRSC